MDEQDIQDFRSNRKKINRNILIILNIHVIWFMTGDPTGFRVPLVLTETHSSIRQSAIQDAVKPVRFARRVRRPYRFYFFCLEKWKHPFQVF